MTTQTIGWAIIHSLWQGAIIAALLALVFAATRRQSASLRYLFGLSGLILMLVLPIATALRTARDFAPAPSVSGTLQSDPTADAGSPIVAPGFPQTPATTSPSVSVSGVETPANNVAQVSSPLGAIRVSPALTNLIVIAWLLGLVIASVRLVGGIAGTLRITRRGASDADASLAALVRSVAERLRVSRPVRVITSVSFDVPLVVGVLRPVLVMPASLLTSVAPWQIEMLIAHELAHVRRYDFLVNLAQTVIETLLFYHPAVRWLSDRIREERENCCDDMAVALAGGDARAYTETLLVLEQSRTSELGLAAAASGGSLLRRARRLLSGESAHLDLGPRWIAGVLTLAAALFTGTEAMGGVQASFIPRENGITQGMTITTEQDPRRKRPDVDPARAAPSKLETAAPAGPLADRVRWAEGRARALGETRYWVGYLVAGDPSGQNMFYSDEIPVRFDDRSTFSGHMHLQRSDVKNLTFYGVPLAPIVGQHNPGSTAIFLLINSRTRSIERIRAGTFDLPVYFDRLPVLWLGAATDRESLDLLRSLSSRTAGRPLRESLVVAAGLHQDSRIVVPLLVSWLRSDTESSDLRAQAAAWLAKHDAVGELAWAARNDRSKEVRRAAIESFAHMKLPAATDTLIAFASSLPDREDRVAVLEALGHREDSRAIAYLTRLVTESGPTYEAMHAVEALGDMPDGRGAEAVIRLARSGQSADVRVKAVEAIASTEPTSRALEALMQVVRSDPSEEVRVHAVEAIADVHDARSIGILRDIANGSFSRRVQVAAVEALGSTVDDRAALAALRSIARSHPSDAVRGRAYETIDDMTER